ncbi:nucleotidyl transferase AbiEii/AbiGii toxin family protein [Chitinophaga eiseniae]|uniref:Nucleotidyl transferase AbiEii/AbiGii toxin family protein n=1 Tax=Chitinophaga eiseniae TaxID=634771 RepID=A0A847SL49_9BACT|nr:nucleotidyl transferase AbiEii/AbiGii toxin family protein [Chitinophaga eiseniae]NLR79885.1 nucleotidyl transferase AbiEii/AbiGii toxin family protein [Chitinophaga eiseniae]
MPDKQLIEDVAIELGISKAFVEKDWHVVQVLKIISSIQAEGLRLTFSGGTSLSKAHKILQRFSEDIDFTVTTDEELSRSQLRKRLSNLKHIVTDAVAKAYTIKPGSEKSLNENKFFTFLVAYPTYYNGQEGMRPDIKVEVSYNKLNLPVVQKPIASFINEVTQAGPEIEAITCTDPIENAADKLSATVWRIIDRDRTAEEDDPTIIRHIHDLHMLSGKALKHPSFKSLCIDTIARDDSRCKKIAGWPMPQKFAAVMEIFKSDGAYTAEYQTFVDGMSYTPNTNTPTFNQAINTLQQVMQFLVAENNTE